MRVSGRWYAILGVLIAAFGVAGLAVARPTGPLALQYLLFTAGGLLFLAAGVPNPVRDRVPWYKIVGAGDVAIGLSLPLGALTRDVSGTADLAYAAAAVVGGLALAVIGLDYLRGGEWFDLPESID